MPTGDAGDGRECRPAIVADKILEKTVTFAAPPLVTGQNNLATKIDKSVPSTSSSTATKKKPKEKTPTAYNMPPGMAAESAKNLFKLLPRVVIGVRSIL